MEKEKEVEINVITLGDVAVGKTSIINWIKDGIFREKYQATIGLDFFKIKRKYEKKNIMISLNFIDTTGQEQYQKTLPLNYIRNSHVVILVFSDFDNLNSLKRRWYSFYKENSNIDNSRFILIGNKSDLFGDNRDEIIKQGTAFAEEIDAHFYTCSVKSADNMDNLERYITTEAKRFIDEEENRPKRYSVKYKLNNDNNFTNGNRRVPTKKKCC